MEILDAVRNDEPAHAQLDMPDEVLFVLSVLGGGGVQADHRHFSRTAYRVPALLATGDNLAPTHHRIYTRDANAWGVGFITPEPLPTGASAWLYIADPNGEGMRLHGHILRCREILPGWYEGAIVLEAPELRLAFQPTPPGG